MKDKLTNTTTSTADRFVESVEEGLERLREFTQHRISFALLMENQNKLEVWYRVFQPCYGELRPYGAKSTRPGDRKPGDLHWPFPAGTPLAVAVPLFHNSSSAPYTTEERNDFILGVANPDNSPWKALFKDYEILYAEEGGIRSILLKDTDIDPTLMVNFFMMLRYTLQGNYIRPYIDLRKNFPDTDPNVILSSILHFNVQKGFDDNKLKYFTNSSLGYTLDQSPEFRRFMEGDFIDLSGGTFKERTAYNRPDLHKVFGSGVQKLGKLLYKRTSTGGSDDFGRLFDEITKAVNEPGYAVEA